MYRIIYVSFEPGDGYIDDLIVPKMNGFSFETVFDAEQYLKKCEFPQIRNKHRREVCLGCKDELHFETIKHEGYEVRYSFNVICYGDLIATTFPSTNPSSSPW